MEDKYKSHPYSDDQTIINTAFDLLMKEQKHNFEVLRSYKNALTHETNEQMSWEDGRIREVKIKVLNWYSKNKD